MAYDNPRGLIAMSVILEILAATAVVMRFMARRKKGASHGIDDWLIVAALVFGTGLTVLEIYGAAIGALGEPLGKNIQDPRSVTGKLNKAKHVELSYLLLGAAGMGLVRLSITFLYRRIFDKPTFRVYLNIWIGILVLHTFAFVIAGLAECGSHLLALFGTPQEYLKTCGSAIPEGYAFVGSGIGADLISIILPIPMIWSLHLPTVRKIQLAAVFMIAFFSLGTSIAKAYIYITASLGLYEQDAITILTAVSVWNLVEVQVGVLVACAPTLRPVIPAANPSASLMAFIKSTRGRISSGESRSVKPSKHGRERLGSDKQSSDDLSSNEMLVLPSSGKNNTTIEQTDLSKLERAELNLREDQTHVSKHVSVERE